MKKKYLLLWLIVLVVLLSGCGASKESTIEDPQENDAETATEEQAPAPKKNTVVIEEAGSDEADANVVKINDVIKIEDVCEAKIVSKDIAKNIYPKSTGGFYTYYDAEAGKVYVDLLIEYNNKSKGAIDIDDAIIGCTMIYDEEYRYDGFCVGEYDDRTHMGTNVEIDSLTKGYIHLLFEVPKEVQDNKKSIKIKFSIDDEDFLFNFR